MLPDAVCWCCLMLTTFWQGEIKYNDQLEHTEKMTRVTSCGKVKCFLRGTEFLLPAFLVCVEEGFCHFNSKENLGWARLG